MSPPGRRRLLAVAVSQLLLACAGRAGNQPTPVSAAPEAVVNVAWEWLSMIDPEARITVEHPERYTLLLQADGRVRIRADCNNGGGTYELSAHRLAFGPLLTTRMACPEDSRDAVFMKALQRVTSYFLRNGELFLELPADGGTMRFRKAG